MKPEWSCLKDVKIIDASQLLPGPHATSLLLQLGADVIKVERRGSGDPSRELGSAVFAQFNRDKRSVALDLRDSADREAFLELVRDCDAVVEGFRPGVMKSFGLGFDDLVKVNPAIVMCSISGFGQTGPYADNAGHDLNYLALAGYWAAPTQVESKVARPGVRVSDYAASSYAALSLVVAIMSARQNGVGQHLDVSIHDSILSWTAPTAWLARNFEKNPVMSPMVMPENDIFETQDGRYIALGILENKFWINLCDCLGEVFPCSRTYDFQRGWDVWLASKRSINCSNRSSGPDPLLSGASTSPTLICHSHRYSKPVSYFATSTYNHAAPFVSLQKRARSRSVFRSSSLLVCLILKGEFPRLGN